MKLFKLSFIALTLTAVLAGCEEDNNATTVTTSNSLNIGVTTTVKDGSVLNTATLRSVGESLFNDTGLSANGTQSCSSCHTPSVGFDDPDSGDATSLGDDGSSIGNRNSPSASYAAFIPNTTTNNRGDRIGGQFWDGRAESLEEQAKGPFLNAVEMGNATKADVIEKLKLASYVDDFTALFGADSLDDVDSAYNYIADAIASFERSTTFSPFTSKFDQVQAGSDSFTNAESRGQNLFNGKGQCDRCHTPDADIPMFTDFEFKNVGVPSNPDLITALGSFTDNGLGDVTGNRGDNGKFKTPHLRNIAITAPYMHNGVFTTLTEVVEFYNTRDTNNVTPEVNQNVDNGRNIGNLRLSSTEIADIVAFLETLTDQ